MKGRRLWTKIAAHGSDVRVYAVKSLVVDGAPCDGCYDPDTNTIEIEWKEDAAAMKAKLLHELLHVCFKAHSADGVAHVLHGKTQDARHKHEEAIVSFLEPVLFTILAGNKFLRLPNPPRPA